MATPPIDLRSDTVTRPSAEMRARMANADVGDDVYGEDPTVDALEKRVAELLGKEAALFVPTGSMGNQIALSLLSRPGDEVIVADGTHAENYESGAAAALSGLQFRHAGPVRDLDAGALLAQIRPNHYTFPRSRLVVLENSHNADGGTVLTPERTRALVSAARDAGLSAHLDGARLWNAATFLRVAEKDLAEPFDTVSVCFSKGLGAPVGSALAGTRDAMTEGRRLRKRLGGGMRQAGVLAAAALYAIDVNRQRLGEDHEHARGLARTLAEIPTVTLDVGRVHTNIVRFDVEGMTAERVVELAHSRGVLLHATGPHSLRAVTHLDVSGADVDRAARILTDCPTSSEGRAR